MRFSLIVMLNSHFCIQLLHWLFLQLVTWKSSTFCLGLRFVSFWVWKLVWSFEALSLYKNSLTPSPAGSYLWYIFSAPYSPKSTLVTLRWLTKIWILRSTIWVGIGDRKDLLNVFYFEVRACLLAISVQVRSVKLVINDILKFKLSIFA